MYMSRQRSLLPTSKWQISSNFRKIRTLIIILKEKFKEISKGKPFALLGDRIAMLFFASRFSLFLEIQKLTTSCLASHITVRLSTCLRITKAENPLESNKLKVINCSVFFAGSPLPGI